MDGELLIVIAIVAAFLSVFVVWIYLNRKIDQSNTRITNVEKGIVEHLASMTKSISSLEADVRELRTDVQWIKKMMEGKGL